MNKKQTKKPLVLRDYYGGINKMPTLTFELAQVAKKSGGDKYQCTTDDKFVIYVPQSISSLPKKEITVEIE